MRGCHIFAYNEVMKWRTKREHADVYLIESAEKENIHIHAIEARCEKENYA